MSRTGTTSLEPEGRSLSDADIRFYFDPVCPFAWMTSKWVRMVQGERGYRVEWRFISLRLINATVDYEAPAVNTGRDQQRAPVENGSTVGQNLR